VALNLSPEQASTLLENLERYIKDPNDRLVLEAFLRLGGRTHEMVTLTEDCIHVSSKRAVCEITAVKGSLDHPVPLPPDFAHQLRRYLRTYEWLGGHQSDADLIESRKVSLRKLYAKYKRRLRMPQGSSLHSLRSAFAAFLYSGSKDILFLKDHLGHKNISSTMAYVRKIEMSLRHNDVLNAFKRRRAS